MVSVEKRPPPANSVGRYWETLTANPTATAMSSGFNSKGSLIWNKTLSGDAPRHWPICGKRVSRLRHGSASVRKTYGKTVHLDGDGLRKILNLYGYTYKERLSNSKIFTQIAKLITDHNINVVFSIVGLMDEPRLWNKKNISNYVEIFIKSSVKKLNDNELEFTNILDDCFNNMCADSPEFSMDNLVGAKKIDSASQQTKSNDDKKVEVYIRYRSFKNISRPSLVLAIGSFCKLILTLPAIA